MGYFFPLVITYLSPTIQTVTVALHKNAFKVRMKTKKKNIALLLVCFYSL